MSAFSSAYILWKRKGATSPLRNAYSLPFLQLPVGRAGQGRSTAGSVTVGLPHVSDWRDLSNTLRRSSPGHSARCTFDVAAR